MKRLRHPIRAIDEPFGKAGLVVAVIALVLALTGAAFAAGALTAKQKKEVEKIAKKYAGKPGPAGAQGPAGPAGKDGAQGEKGAQGAKGDPGSPGSPGAPGTPGAAGKSVEEVDSGPSLCNGSGGYVYEIEDSGEPNEVCNGEKGDEGEPGALHAGETLPPGATETGAWGIASPGAEVGAPISFPIPLAERIEASHIHYGIQGAIKSSCDEGSLGLPKANPGELCIYEGEASKATFGEVLTPEFGITDGTSVSGAQLLFNIGEGGFAYGSFAVTGCSKAVGAQYPCP